MSLYSTVLSTNHGIILMDEKNIAFYNVIIKTNHQSDNSFFRGVKKEYIIHTNPYKTPILENFKLENGKRICLRIKAIWCLPRIGNIAFSNICCFKKNSSRQSMYLDGDCWFNHWPPCTLAISTWNVTNPNWDGLPTWKHTESQRINTYIIFILTTSCNDNVLDVTGQLTLLPKLKSADSFLFFFLMWIPENFKSRLWLALYF